MKKQRKNSDRRRLKITLSRGVEKVYTLTISVAKCMERREKHHGERDWAWLGVKGRAAGKEDKVLGMTGTAAK